jgi:hypothetical protein
MEEESLVNVAAAFEGPFCELAEAQAGMNVGSAKCFSQVTQGQETFDSTFLRQHNETPQDNLVNDEGFVQSSIAFLLSRFSPLPDRSFAKAGPVFIS